MDFKNILPLILLFNPSFQLVKPSYSNRKFGLYLQPSTELGTLCPKTKTTYNLEDVTHMNREQAAEKLLYVAGTTAFINVGQDSAHVEIQCFNPSKLLLNASTFHSPGTVSSIPVFYTGSGNLRLEENGTKILDEDDDEFLNGKSNVLRTKNGTFMLQIMCDENDGLNKSMILQILSRGNFFPFTKTLMELSMELETDYHLKITVEDEACTLVGDSFININVTGRRNDTKVQKNSCKNVGNNPVTTEWITVLILIASVVFETMVF